MCTEKQPQHGYLFQILKDTNEVNESATHLGLKNISFFCWKMHIWYPGRRNSHKIFEIKTFNKQINSNCQLCSRCMETVHYIATCRYLKASVYFPLTLQCKLANVIYQNIMAKKWIECRQPMREFYYNECIKVWLNNKVKKLTHFKHNEPDIVVWSKVEKRCFIIDTSIGLDINIAKNLNQKCGNYLLITAELKRLYNNHTIEIILIVPGGTGIITYSLKLMLKQIGVENVNNAFLKMSEECIIWKMGNC